MRTITTICPMVAINVALIKVTIFTLYNIIFTITFQVFFCAFWTHYWIIAFYFRMPKLLASITSYYWDKFYQSMSFIVYTDVFPFQKFTSPLININQPINLSTLC